MSIIFFVNACIFYLFQPWETDCRCGNRDEWKSIVQFYQEYENNVWQIVKSKPTLKIPIGLGTLISYRHVLTSKTCFGRLNNVGVWQQQECYHENIHLNLNVSTKWFVVV